MLNLDSLFDAENIISVVRRLQKPAKVLIRVNPGLEYSNTPVHSYLATALKNSKFGVSLNQLDKVLNISTQYTFGVCFTTVFFCCEGC